MGSDQLGQFMAAVLMGSRPGVSVSFNVDLPEDRYAGAWFVDVCAEPGQVTVQYVAAQGFGVYFPEVEHGLGTRPDLLLEQPADAAFKVLELLEKAE